MGLMKYLFAILMMFSFTMQAPLLANDQVTLDDIEEIQPESQMADPTPEEEATYEKEVQEAIEQSQAEFGTGATPTLPTPPSTFWRNIAMVVVTAITFTLGVTATRHNPGRVQGS